MRIWCVCFVASVAPVATLLQLSLLLLLRLFLLWWWWQRRFQFLVETRMPLLLPDLTSRMMLPSSRGSQQDQLISWRSCCPPCVQNSEAVRVCRNGGRFNAQGKRPCGQTAKFWQSLLGAALVWSKKVPGSCDTSCAQRYWGRNIVSCI